MSGLSDQVPACAQAVEIADTIRNTIAETLFIIADKLFVINFVNIQISLDNSVNLSASGHHHEREKQTDS
jgi:hypothetical protein